LIVCGFAAPSRQPSATVHSCLRCDAKLLLPIIQLTFQSNDSTSGTPPSRRFTSSINRRAISGRRRFTISTTRSCRFGESWARCERSRTSSTSPMQYLRTSASNNFSLVAGSGMTEQLGQTVATLLALPGHLDDTFCGGRFVDTVLAIFDRAVLGSAVFSFTIFGRTIAGSMPYRSAAGGGDAHGTFDIV
uniref:Uncharacterized protein n=1 Tax=Anopheles melas TaxID=34690 RepID=A0A182UL77_9DIPT